MPDVMQFALRYEFQEPIQIQPPPSLNAARRLLVGVGNVRRKLSKAAQEMIAKSEHQGRLNEVWLMRVGAIF